MEISESPFLLLFSALVRLTDTSASTQGARQSYFIDGPLYKSCMGNLCENAIQVSWLFGNLCRLQEFIFTTASPENDILTPFTWKSLCLFICDSGLCADRTPQRDALLLDINSKEAERQEKEERKGG